MAASAATTSATSGPVLAVRRIGRGRLAGAGQVAGPPAHLGEVDQAVVVQGVAAGQRLELGAGQGQRAEAQVQAGQPQVDGSVGSATVVVARRSVMPRLSAGRRR